MSFITRILLLGGIGIVLISCSPNKKGENISNEMSSHQTEIELIGRKATITYPNFKAEVTYVSDSLLHWKTVDATNHIEEGTERISYRKIAPNTFFINWIEKDGTTVSQVIKVDERKVYAYLSYDDTEKGRGGRNGNAVEGLLDLK